MSKLLKNLKKKITVFAVMMIALQPVLGLVMLPAKTFAIAAPVVINEVLPNPSTTEPDNEWIELYNTTDNPIDLSGWTLSDASGTPVYGLTGSIAAYGYLVLMGSDTSIELNNIGDTIYLKDPGSTEIDNMTYPTAVSREDESYARNPNDPGNFVWDSTPTKNKFNNITVPDAPTLVSPSSGTYLSVDDVDLIWSPVVDSDGDTVTYTLQYSMDPSFSVSTTEVTGIATTTHTITDSIDGKFYWRVLANDGHEDGDYSTISNFTVDITKPVITLVGDNPQTIELGQPYVELGATVTDNLDPAPALRTTMNVNTSVIGTYTVTYDAVDVAGNNAVQIIRTVNVVSPVVVTPIVTGPLAPAVVTAEVPVDNQVYGAESYQGEVKADTEIKADEGNNTEGNNEDQPEDTKGERNVPLWGIIFLLILAGIGGYLFYSQSPDKTKQ